MEAIHLPLFCRQTGDTSLQNLKRFGGRIDRHRVAIQAILSTFYIMFVFRDAPMMPPIVANQVPGHRIYQARKGNRRNHSAHSHQPQEDILHDIFSLLSSLFQLFDYEKLHFFIVLFIIISNHTEVGLPVFHASFEFVMGYRSRKDKAF